LEVSKQNTNPKKTQIIEDAETGLFSDDSSTSEKLDTSTT